VAKQAQSYKELVATLNQSLAEAHARAPAEKRAQIEKGYGEVVHKMGHLLTVASDPTTSVWCSVVLPDGTLSSFPATLDYCQQHGCTPMRKEKPPDKDK
jgi:hypothetical protein